jgi:two-component system response regulator HydG
VASNERLSELTRKGKFREDLYHRFNEFSIDLPPLRDRGEDIMLYASFFLERTCTELNKKILSFSDEVVHIFTTYPWPGNLRELHNVIKRAALLTLGDAIEVEALPIEITYFDKSDSALNESDSKSVFMSEVDIRHASIDAEFEVIMAALKKCNYNKSKAATMLNIDRKTLYNKMKRYREFNGGL